MKLDLSPLENAVGQLGDGLVQYDSHVVREFPQIRHQMRAGAIQAFEFTYELSVGMIKRHLEQMSANPAQVEELSFRDLIRKAWQLGLLRSELDSWMHYRANRGTTSHTYIDEKAERVFQGVPELLEEDRYLLAQLQARNERLE
jgi:nucleotidyltransferase substrate binding protein (TIGR01987 family)